MPRGMQSADPATRARVASAGGHGRAAAMTPAELAEAARIAARGAHTAVTLARRIVKVWPNLDEQERADVRSILANLEESAR